jgi:hypothetical protein
MPRKVFTAGEVLAAADVNEFLMDQAVQSFAGTAARGSAIPTPVAGMTTYLEDSKNLEIYDGTSYASPFGLTLVKSQVIGAAVSSIVVSNAFNSTFENYIVTISGGSSSTTTILSIQLGSTTTGYYQAGAGVNYSTAAVTGRRVNNGTNFLRCGYGEPDGLNLYGVIQSPFLSKYTSAGFNFGYLDEGMWQAGYQASTTSFTDFTILLGGPTATGGTINVYGLRA